MSLYIEKLKSKILEKITEDELNKRVEEIKAENGGLLSDEAAVSTIASEIGVSIEEEYEEEDNTILIKDISEGQSNVEVIGRITDIPPIREFSRKDGTVGKVGSLVIKDNTGSIRLTLWNDKVDLLNNLKVGDVVEITGATSRSWNNKIDLNSIGTTEVVKLEKGEYDESNYPIVKDEYLIEELKPGDSATINGEIIICYDTKEFPRRDGTVGKVKSFILKDETGTIRCALWNEDADINLNKGDKVKVKGNVKEGFREGLDLNVNNIEIIEKGNFKEEEPTEESIKNLTNCNGKIVNLKGRIINISNIKTVSFGDRDATVQEITLNDGTGTVGVAFWNNNIEKIRENNIKEGDGIKITNCKVKTYTNYEVKEIPSVSAQRNSNIIKIELDDIPEVNENIINIKDIYKLDEEQRNNVSIIGKVSEIYDLRTFERRNGTIGKVRSVLLEDETGKIRLSLWDSDAELDLKEGDIIKVLRGYVREKDGFYDLNIGRIGKIIVNPEGVSLNIKINRKFIKELEEGDEVEIRGAIVSYRNQDLVINLCPKCNKRVSSEEDGHICPNCGEIEPKELTVATITVDDGTSNIICRLYGSAVSKLTNIPLNQLKNENVDILEKLICSEYILTGVVKEGFNGLEYSVRNVKNINLDNEIKLLKEL